MTDETIYGPQDQERAIALARIMYTHAAEAHRAGTPLADIAASIGMVHAMFLVDAYHDYPTRKVAASRMAEASLTWSQQLKPIRTGKRHRRGSRGSIVGGWSGEQRRIAQSRLADGRPKIGFGKSDYRTQMRSNAAVPSSSPYKFAAHSRRFTFELQPQTFLRTRNRLLLLGHRNEFNKSLTEVPLYTLRTLLRSEVVWTLGPRIRR
jgi:hypothetical protein